MTLYGKTDAGCAAGRPVELEDPTPERRRDSPDCFMPLGIELVLMQLRWRRTASSTLKRRRRLRRHRAPGKQTAPTSDSFDTLRPPPDNPRASPIPANSHEERHQ